MGIIVGAALFVVLSVFSGLKVLVFRLPMISTGFKISSTLGNLFCFSRAGCANQKIEGVASYSKIIEERVLFVYDDK
jgi:lipoprotein-releasing system permease protein